MAAPTPEDFAAARAQLHHDVDAFIDAIVLGDTARVPEEAYVIGRVLGAILGAWAEGRRIAPVVGALSVIDSERAMEAALGESTPWEIATYLAAADERVRAADELEPRPNRAVSSADVLECLEDALEYVERRDAPRGGGVVEPGSKGG